MKIFSPLTFLVTSSRTLSMQREVNEEKLTTMSWGSEIVQLQLTQVFCDPLQLVLSRMSRPWLPLIQQHFQPYPGQPPSSEGQDQVESQSSDEATSKCNCWLHEKAMACQDFKVLLWSTFDPLCIRGNIVPFSSDHDSDKCHDSETAALVQWVSTLRNCVMLVMTEI